MEKTINYFTFFILIFFLSSCSPVSSVVSLAANAGISSKGFSASVDDSYLKAKIIGKISTLEISNLIDVKVSVSLGEVLLTGYSNDQISRLRLIENVSKINENATKNRLKHAITCRKHARRSIFTDLQQLFTNLGRFSVLGRRLKRSLDVFGASRMR